MIYHSIERTGRSGWVDEWMDGGWMDRRTNTQTGDMVYSVVLLEIKRIPSEDLTLN